MYNFFQYADG